MDWFHELLEAVIVIFFICGVGLLIYEVIKQETCICKMVREYLKNLLEKK